MFEDKSILNKKKVLSLHWESQMDSATGQWGRMCQSSSSAMFCEYYRPGCLSKHPKKRPGEQNDDFYLRILNELFGDSTDPQAHTKMHSWLGVNSKFRINGTRETLEWHLSRGFVVMTGQLHHDYYTNPDPTRSHWNLCVGWTPENDSFVFHDSAGHMDVQNGGYIDNNGKYMKYPWTFWKRRWMASASGAYMPGTGWCHVPVTDKVTGTYIEIPPVH
jgi:hypothetical protein